MPSRQTLPDQDGGWTSRAIAAFGTNNQTSQRERYGGIKIILCNLFSAFLVVRWLVSNCKHYLSAPPWSSNKHLIMSNVNSMSMRHSCFYKRSSDVAGPFESLKSNHCKKKKRLLIFGRHQMSILPRVPTNSLAVYGSTDCRIGQQGLGPIQKRCIKKWSVMYPQS